MVPERPPLEIASAVNKVFMMELNCSVAWSGEIFGGTAQPLAAKHQNDNHDQENEAERAAANPDATGKNRRE
jgi:hypothetical protein